MLMRFDRCPVFNPMLTRAWRQQGAKAPAAMPIDIHRGGDAYVIHVDLPGVDESAVDVSVERNFLTIEAKRTWTPDEDTEFVVTERPQGVFTRQLYLGDALDTEHIEAHCDAGVLTVTIPVAEAAKPRKVEIAAGRPTPAEDDSKVLAS